MDCKIETANGTVLDVTEIKYGESTFKKTMGIYIIYNNVNKKCYVGQTNNLRKRKKDHRTTLNKKIHGNKYLQRSCDKYGLDSFIFYVVKVVDDAEKLNEVELKYIKLLETRMNKYGYNLKLDTYTRDGENIGNEYGKIMPTLRIPVVQLDLNGNFVNRYDCATLAGRILGFDYAGISRNCKKEQGMAYGYIWVYEHEYNNTEFCFDKLSLELPNIENRKYIQSGEDYRNDRVVYQFSQDFILISTYKNALQTKQFGFQPKQVYKCCNGRLKKYRNFIWVYKKDVPAELII